jgi:hypothetical protein
VNGGGGVVENVLLLPAEIDAVPMVPGPSLWTVKNQWRWIASTTSDVASDVLLGLNGTMCPSKRLSVRSAVVLHGPLDCPAHEAGLMALLWVEACGVVFVPVDPPEHAETTIVKTMAVTARVESASVCMRFGPPVAVK